MAKATKKPRAGKPRIKTVDDARRRQAAELAASLRHHRRIKTLETQLRRAMKTADVGLESLHAALAESGYGAGVAAATVEPSE